jgi:peptide deformylase
VFLFFFIFFYFIILTKRERVEMLDAKRTRCKCLRRYLDLSYYVKYDDELAEKQTNLMYRVLLYLNEHVLLRCILYLFFFLSCALVLYLILLYRPHHYLVHSSVLFRKSRDISEGEDMLSQIETVERMWQLHSLAKQRIGMSSVVMDSPKKSLWSALYEWMNESSNKHHQAAAAATTTNTIRTRLGYCGVTAAHLHSYVKLAIINTATENKPVWNWVTNPRYECVGERSSSTSESLFFCPESPLVNSTRCQQVSASYRANAQTVEVKLEGNSAFCFQALTDIMNGVWPCNETPLRIPTIVLPDETEL